MSYQKYHACIEACIACAVACNECADACLQEKEVEKLRTCIRLDRECSAFCRSTAEIMMLDGQYAEALCLLCADICSTCAEECRKHAAMGMEHCRICSEACSRCADECTRMSESSIPA